MFDTIFLLAGQAEQVAMPPVLRGYNPRLSVASVANSADLAPEAFSRASLSTELIRCGYRFA